MLPGFRFLFAAIVLCMSVLVFGLGAAALLRAAHEDFASNPTWRAPPEPLFAQQEATRPTLAILSLQPAPAEEAAAPKVAEADAAITTGTSTTTAPAPSPEPETTAASTPPDASASERAKPAPPAIETAPAQMQTGAAPADVRADSPASETKIAAADETKTAPPDSVSPAASESASPLEPSPTPQQITAPSASGPDQAATRIATLGGPAVIIDPRATATTGAHAMLDRSQINKRLLAELAQARAKEQAKEHAKESRRLAVRRARARQAATLQQQADNPFAPHPLVGPTPAR